LDKVNRLKLPARKQALVYETDKRTGSDFFSSASPVLAQQKARYLLSSGLLFAVLVPVR
jgi:hypothetical protein